MSLQVLTMSWGTESVTEIDEVSKGINSTSSCPVNTDYFTNEGVKSWKHATWLTIISTYGIVNVDIWQVYNFRPCITITFTFRTVVIEDLDEDKWARRTLMNDEVHGDEKFIPVARFRHELCLIQVFGQVRLRRRKNAGPSICPVLGHITCRHLWLKTVGIYEYNFNIRINYSTFHQL